MKKRLAKREESEYETINMDDIFGKRFCDLWGFYRSFCHEVGAPWYQGIRCLVMCG
jgi:hypothetical protein